MSCQMELVSIPAHNKMAAGSGLGMRLLPKSVASLIRLIPCHSLSTTVCINSYLPFSPVPEIPRHVLNCYLPSFPVPGLVPRLNTSFSFYWNSSTLSYVIHINWTLPLIYDIPKVVQAFQLTGSTMLLGRLIPSFRNFDLIIPAVSVFVTYKYIRIFYMNSL